MPQKKSENAIPNRRLSQARLQRHWSQRELAARLDASFVTVSRWESGVTTPGPYFRKLLCELFEKTPQELGLVPEPGQEEQEAPLARWWSVPYPRNPLFTGRDPLLEALHQQLGQEHRAALSQSTVLSGLGGIGKTATALEYAYRHASDYTALFWIGAETTERLVSSFVTLAETLQLPERLEFDTPRMVAAVLRWLATHPGWLLIFDNVEDLETVKPFVPTVPHGSILLTTRLQAVGTLAPLVTVETMGLAEGTLFLLHRARLLPLDTFLDRASLEQIEAAETLVIALDFLPLALDQAGAYIEETGCSLSAYLDLYHTRRKELLRRRGQGSPDHPEPVATTWSLAFQKIEQTNQAAADLLRLCAFLEPESIPEELLRAASAFLGPTCQGLASDVLQFHSAIEQLCRFSLVQHDPKTQFLRIHRLVQAVLKDTLDIPNQHTLAEQVVQAIHAVFPASVGTATWTSCQRFLTQAQACSTLIQEAAITSEEAAILLFRIATYLQQVALYEQAEPLFQQVVIMREQLLTQERVHIIDSLEQLAILTSRKGKFEQAESLFQRVLRLCEQTFGVNHLRTANLLGELATLYRLEAKYEQAELLLQRAIHIQEQASEPDRVGMAHLLEKLADIYWEQGKFEQAEPLLWQTVSLLEAVLGSNHHDVALSLTLLANLLNQRGKYEQAEPLYQRALAIWEKALGTEHPRLGAPLVGLANLFMYQGQCEQAEPLYQRALQIWERTHGPEHPDVAHTLNNLAELYREQGKDEQAEVFSKQALQIWGQTLGPEHPNVAYPLTNLAHLYLKRGQDEQAEPLYLRALSIWERALGPEHPNVAEVLFSLATLAFRQGKDEQAGSLYQRALDIRTQKLDPQHPHLAESLHGLATFQEAQNNLEEAISLYRHALLIWENLYGSHHPKTMETRKCLSHVLQATGKTGDAVMLQTDQSETGIF